MEHKNRTLSAKTVTFQLLISVISICFDNMNT